MIELEQDVLALEIAMSNSGLGDGEARVVFFSVILVEEGETCLGWVS